MSRLVLGADLSTDSLKWMVFNADTLQMVADGNLNFVAEFGQSLGLTVGGYIEGENGAVRIPYELFPMALDRMLEQVKAALKADMSFLRRICVSVQQHGMVALRSNFEAVLADMSSDPTRSLDTLVKDLCTTSMATSWRDTSSLAVCEQLEQALPADRWAEVSGSSPMQSLRFMGPQVARLYAESPQVFHDTSQFSVLASFVAMLLVGRAAPIGADEASCTLMMNLARDQWSDLLLRYLPKGTRKRLSPIAKPCLNLGAVGSYWFDRHGVPACCQVLLGMGDNIAAQLTTADVPGQISVSGGSSGTVYCGMPKASFDPAHASHVLRSYSGYMGMFCTSHCGKLADEVRVQAGLSWAQFDDAVANPQWEDYGNPIFVRGDRVHMIRHCPPHEMAQNVTRSIVANMKLHSEFMGHPKSLVATGGFITPPVAQVVADVFGCPVAITPKVDRVALGSVIACIRDLTDWPLGKIITAVRSSGQTIQPNLERADFYLNFGGRFRAEFLS